MNTAQGPLGRVCATQTGLAAQPRGPSSITDLADARSAADRRGERGRYTVQSQVS